MKHPAARLRFWARCNGADVWTLGGWILARAAGAQLRPLGGVWLAVGGRLPWVLAHYPFGAVQAMAVGRVILAGDAASLRCHLRHEWAHVRQFARFGLFFPLLYLLELLRQVLRGKSPYFDNFFECEARRNECRAPLRQPIQRP